MCLPSCALSLISAICTAFLLISGFKYFPEEEGALFSVHFCLQRSKCQNVERTMGHRGLCVCGASSWRDPACLYCVNVYVGV